MKSFLKYHGGKARLARKIISMMPDHNCYVEPFGGGAAVLLNKHRARLEVYNDLDGDVVAMFRVLRDRPDDLLRAVALTPFARAEHEMSYEHCDDEVERARRLLVRSHFGFGSSGIHRRTGFRAAGMRAGSLPVHFWEGFPAIVADTAKRMRSVVIECRPAVDVMKAHDAPGVVHYVDPPYLPETRGPGRDYRHEMSPEDHEALLDCLIGLKGNVVLSGYASGMYDTILRDWRRVEFRAMADRAMERVEVVWRNFEEPAPLFGVS